MTYVLESQHREDAFKGFKRGTGKKVEGNHSSCIYKFTIL
jgi:hypothetical protein